MAPPSDSVDALHSLYDVIITDYSSAAQTSICEIPCGMVMGLNVAVVAYGGTRGMEGGL